MMRLSNVLQSFIRRPWNNWVTRRRRYGLEAFTLWNAWHRKQNFCRAAASLVVDVVCAYLRMPFSF